MSRPRYWWYGNVCRIISQYPDLCQRIEDQRGQQITARYNSSGTGAQSGRAMEEGIIRTVSTREYADWEAVTMAIEKAKQWKDAASVMDVVSAHCWGKRESFEIIAEKKYMSVGTAKRMHGRFVYLVAREIGYANFG